MGQGGTLFNQSVTGYIRWGGTVYEVTYTPVSGTLGTSTTITVNVDVDKCSGSTCTTNFDSKNIVYTLGVTNGFEDQFVSWENSNVNTVSTLNTPTLVYYTTDDDLSSDSNTTCDGWDPNTDTSSDDHSGYNLRFPTVTPQDTRGALFTVGDIIPFDWQTDHKTDILKRLAPNQIATPAAAPDFRVAPYLADVPVSGFLRLKDRLGVQRPLIPSGSTPLGATLSSFKSLVHPGSAWRQVQDPELGIAAASMRRSSRTVTRPAMGVPAPRRAAS